MHQCPPPQVGVIIIAAPFVLFSPPDDSVEKFVEKEVRAIVLPEPRQATLCMTHSARQCRAFHEKLTRFWQTYSLYSGSLYTLRLETSAKKHQTFRRRCSKTVMLESAVTSHELAGQPAV